MEISLSDIQHFKGKYPKQLYLLFFTEMWERFTFYGNRALLLLFMTNYLHFADEKGNLIYGTYQSLIYAVPVVGGFLADKYLGQRKAIVWGAILLTIGSFVMAIPMKDAFFMGMGILIAGNAFFKPNISTIVGNLYKPDDGRRDAGFSFFYMGINVGGFLGGLLCGWIGQKYNWHMGFGLAGVFMIVGLVTFLKKQAMLGPVGLPSNYAKVFEEKKAGLTTANWIYVASILSIPLFILLLHYYTIYSYIINPFGIIALVYVLYTAIKLGKDSLMKILASLVLIVFSGLFWAFYEQGGGSLNLFAERNVDMHLMGYELSSASVNNSINSLMIVLLTPLFVWLWIFLNKRKAEPNAAVKFALALLQLGLGFYMLVVGGQHANNGMVSLWYFVLGYLFMTTGELCLSPIGLSAITKLSPSQMLGTMMACGFWLVVMDNI